MALKIVPCSVFFSNKYLSFVGNKMGIFGIFFVLKFKIISLFLGEIFQVFDILGEKKRKEDLFHV